LLVIIYQLLSQDKDYEELGGITSMNGIGKRSKSGSCAV